MASWPRTVSSKASFLEKVQEPGPIDDRDMIIAALKYEKEDGGCGFEVSR